MDIPSWKCFYLNRSVPARFWNVCHLHFNILYFVLFFIIKIRWPILNRVAQVVVLTMSLLFLKCTIMLKSSFICKGWRLNHLFLCNAIPVFGTANKSSFVICAICFFFLFGLCQYCFVVFRWSVYFWSPSCKSFTVFIHLLVLTVRMHSLCYALVLNCIWQPVICQFMTSSPTPTTNIPVLSIMTSRDQVPTWCLCSKHGGGRAVGCF